MRILFLTARLPYPPDRGDRLRAHHLLRHLSADHEITLVSFIQDERERAQAEELAPFYQEIKLVRRSARASAAAAALNAWRPLPLQALYYRSAAMARLIAATLEGGRFDAAYVHLFRMAPYVPPMPGLYRILDLTDTISAEVAGSLPYRGAFWRAVYRIERPRIARYECAAARSFDESWLISEHDRAGLAARCPGANLQVIPNGVNLARFRPASAARPNRLAFVGHLSVFHNVDAAVYLANEILPRVRAERPDVELHIVGARPSPAVRRLNSLPGVSVTGYVDDLNAELNEAAVFVAPLRFAAGVQNKVLEAMAAGRPVVTSYLVAHGLGAEVGRHLLAADDPDAFAGEVLGLLADANRREAIGAAGRALVAERFSWEIARQRVAAIEEELANRVGDGGRSGPEHQGRGRG